MMNIEQKTDTGNNEFSNNVVSRPKPTKTEKIVHKLGDFVGAVLAVCFTIIVISAALVLTTILLRAMLMRLL